MNYHNITSPDMLNGSGLRTVLWVSGCTNKCPGCHNPQTHSFTSGIPFDEKALNELIDKLRPDYIQGLTLSGGDPMHERNVPQVLDIVRLVRREFEFSKDIWIYTGYRLDELLARRDDDTTELIRSINVLVDGKFELDKKDPLLHFRGSSNQRILKITDGLNGEFYTSELNL